MNTSRAFKWLDIKKYIPGCKMKFFYSTFHPLLQYKELNDNEFRVIIKRAFHVCTYKLRGPSILKAFPNIVIENVNNF